MPGLPSTFISPEILKDAQRESSGRLTPPEGANISGVPGQKGYRASWTEVFDISKIETKPGKDNNGWVITAIQTCVAPDLPGANTGRTAFIRFNLFPAAQGQKSHEYHGLHSKGIARMGNILTAAGCINDGDGFNPVDFFDVPDSPLLGRRVCGVVSQFVRRDGTEDQEISNFTPFGTF